MLSYQEEKEMKEALKKSVRKPYRADEIYVNDSQIIDAMRKNVSEVVENLIDKDGVDVKELRDLIEGVAIDYAFKVKLEDYEKYSIKYGKVTALIYGYSDIVLPRCSLNEWNNEYIADLVENDEYFCIGDYNFLKE